MNWLSFLLKALGMIKPAVQVVELEIADSKKGATKKQMVHDAVTGGLDVASTMLSPADQQKAQLVSSIVNNTIDSTVASLKATGQMPVPITVAGTVMQGVAAAAGIAAAVEGDQGDQGDQAAPAAPAPAAAKSTSDNL